MEKYNLIMVLNKTETKILMCYRSKDPYKNKYNFVGGKIEEGESSISSAYRELYEETGISKNEINLKPLMDYVWHPAHMSMDVYIGKLSNDMELIEEVNKLHWIDVKENFFDMERFAGEGNIGHMIRIYEILRTELEL